MSDARAMREAPALKAVKRPRKPGKGPQVCVSVNADSAVGGRGGAPPRRHTCIDVPHVGSRTRRGTEATSNESTLNRRTRATVDTRDTRARPGLVRGPASLPAARRECANVLFR